MLQSAISPSLRHLTRVAKSLIFLIRKRMGFWRTTGNKTQPCHKLTRTRGNGGSLRWSSAAPLELMARPLQGLACLGGFASRQRMICSVCSNREAAGCPIGGQYGYYLNLELWLSRVPDCSSGAICGHTERQVSL